MTQRLNGKFVTSIHGLNIESYVKLSSRSPVSEVIDVTVKKGSLLRDVCLQRFGVGEIFQHDFGVTAASASEFFLDQEGYGRFLIEGGTKVTVDPTGDTNDEALSAFITGPVLGVLLHQLGYLVIHASAVRIGNGAFLFLGNKGFGKSTLAAHLQMRDHFLVSDDIVPISIESGKVITKSGYPQIRLLEDAVHSIGEQPERWALTNEFLPKHKYGCGKRFVDSKVEISGVVLLSKSDEIDLRRVSASEGFVGLLRNSYVHRYIATTGAAETHFRLCHVVSSSVPAFSLARPFDFGSMSRVIDLLEELSHELN